MLLCLAHHLLHKGGFTIDMDYRDRRFFRRPDGSAVLAGHRFDDMSDDGTMETEHLYTRVSAATRTSAETWGVRAVSAETYAVRRTLSDSELSPTIRSAVRSRKRVPRDKQWTAASRSPRSSAAPAEVSTSAANRVHVVAIAHRSMAAVEHPAPNLKLKMSTSVRVSITFLDMPALRECYLTADLAKPFLEPLFRSV